MTLNQRNVQTTASLLLGAAGTLHLIRAVSGWEVLVNGWLVPMWLSWVLVVLAGYLSYRLCPWIGKRK